MAIINRIADAQADMTAWRHAIHSHPETAFEEVQTSELVAQRLAEFGIEVHRGIADTGVVGVLHGAGGPPIDEMRGKAVGLRADMDALNVAEHNHFAHASKVPGKMHACGHDGHTAMLLGAAKYLAETRNFAGTVNFIFQPAEEGRGGGKRMVAEGLFTRFPCDLVFGMHNWPDLPVGEFGVMAGPMMASADRFEIVVKGRGGHAALPHHTVDPMVVAAQLVVAAQTLVSRNLSPIEAGVVSITQIKAGTADNIIPSEVWLAGTLRALSQEVRLRLEEGLRHLSQTLPAAFGAEAVFTFKPGYPPTVNDPRAAEIAAQAAAQVVGTECVHRNLGPSMGAEDFSYMLLEKPGAYVWVGNGGGPGAGGNCMLHNPTYDFNDEILGVGASFWARLVETVLAK